jgi:hypothetical protein
MSVLCAFYELFAEVGLGILHIIEADLCPLLTSKIMYQKFHTSKNRRSNLFGRSVIHALPRICLTYLS